MCVSGTCLRKKQTASLLLQFLIGRDVVMQISDTFPGVELRSSLTRVSPLISVSERSVFVGFPNSGRVLHWWKTRAENMEERPDSKFNEIRGPAVL